MNKQTYGEKLFQSYLESEGVKFDYEPVLPGISQLIDFVVDHPTRGKILLEVKDIENPPPVGSFGQIRPNEPIRKHIDAGVRKFKATSDYVCALVVCCPPGCFAQVTDPDVMLAAMYGDIGFRVPLDMKGEEADQITPEFIIGNGKMIRPGQVRNTRIAALITVQEYQVWKFAMRKYAHTDDGRSRDERYADIQSGLAPLPDYEEMVTGVTVWENGFAAKKLPHDLFKGEMDAWWESRDACQVLAFVGERRRALGIDENQ